MKQAARPPKRQSFAAFEFAQKKRTTRRDKLLAEMEQVVPWARLEELISAKYPTSGRVGRPPIVPHMLRMCFLQQWFGQADEAVEDAIYDSRSIRNFVGIEKRPEIVEAQKKEALRKDIKWHVAQRRSKIGKMAEATIKKMTQALEKVKAHIRARVEHPFHVVKNLFRYKKVRYRGLAKNTA